MSGFLGYTCPVGFTCPLDWCQAIWLLVALGVGLSVGYGCGRGRRRASLLTTVRATEETKR